MVKDKEECVANLKREMVVFKDMVLDVDVEGVIVDVQDVEVDLEVAEGLVPRPADVEGGIRGGTEDVQSMPDSKQLHIIVVKVSLLEYIGMSLQHINIAVDLSRNPTHLYM